VVTHREGPLDGRPAILQNEPIRREVLSFL